MEGADRPRAEEAQVLGLTGVVGARRGLDNLMQPKKKPADRAPPCHLDRAESRRTDDHPQWGRRGLAALPPAAHPEASRGLRAQGRGPGSRRWCRGAS